MEKVPYLIHTAIHAELLFTFDSMFVILLLKQITQGVLIDVFWGKINLFVYIWNLSRSNCCIWLKLYSQRT